MFKNRALVLVFIAAFGAMASFYLLLSVVPLYAASGAGVAGLTTGILMLTTVGAELAMPRLLARFGYRPVFAAALLLLGAPAVALTFSSNLVLILAVCALRGLGVGIFVVIGSALVGLLVPPARRGEGLGVYGVVVGVPAVVGIPLGVWLVGHVGYPPVFVAGAVTALAGLAIMPLLPGLPGRQATPERSAGVVAGLRDRTLMRPAVVFAATAMVAGVVVTFLPLAVAGGIAAVGLLVQALAATVGRWLAGRYGDRRGSGRLLIPAVVASAVGVLALVLASSPVAVVAGMVVFGAGFGVAQNASIALMFERVDAARYGAVSAVWNLAYDAGLGLGAAGFGVVAGWTGYSTAFALTAVVTFAALVPAWRDRRTAPATRVDGSVGV